MSSFTLIRVDSPQVQLQQQTVVEMVREMKPGDRFPVELYVKSDDTDVIFLLKDVIVGSLQNRLHGLYGLTASGQTIRLGES